MSEPRLCCNCLHCARWRKKDGIECHCDLNDKYLGYLTVMDEENDCKHWEKETKWDLQREHDEEIAMKVIDEFSKRLKGIKRPHTKYLVSSFERDIDFVTERLREEMNSPYQDQSLCQGLYYAIQRCDWFLSEDKEQNNDRK